MVTVYIYSLYMRGPKKKIRGGGQSDSCVCHGGPRHHIFGSLKFKKFKFSGPLEPPPPNPSVSAHGSPKMADSWDWQIK